MQKNNRMEYSELYKIALELEGLILLLKDNTLSNEKRDDICHLIAGKARVIEDFIFSPETSDHRDDACSNGGTCTSDCQDGCEYEQTESDDNEVTVSENFDNLSQSSEEDASAIADNALFEEAEDADGNAYDDQQPSALEEEPHGQEDTQITDSPDESLPEIRPVTVTDEDVTAAVDVNISAFAHKAKGDIRKYFTLNDNYKFRRELFENSGDRYSAALSYIESLPSLQSAKDYCFNILGWDNENDEVKEFINIISAYFIK